MFAAVSGGMHLSPRSQIRTTPFASARAIRRESGEKAHVRMFALYGSSGDVDSPGCASHKRQVVWSENVRKQVRSGVKAYSGIPLPGLAGRASRFPVGGGERLPPAPSLAFG